jgi:hypothetical protein
MRAARLVGLSPNGKYVIVVTDSGEELAIAADDRLRAALRGDRPRLGQLEIEMESALGPREIQTRIRAGESVEDVARAAGIPTDRVERFAGPVIAEREHIAQQAMKASVRRRGETAAHRNLRGVVSERLGSRGVDVDAVAWDSFRMSDGRWAVTATYASGEAERQAHFLYDAQGRFSVAGNDDAAWILGDSSASHGPQPGRQRPTPEESSEGDDFEPTLDLSDELALVRAVQDQPDNAVPVTTGPEDPGAAEDSARAEEAASVGHSAGPTDVSGPSDSGGPTDASAVPETPLRVVQGGWEPAIMVDYPVEPGPAEEPTDEPGPPDPPTSIEDRRDEAHQFEDEHELALHEIPAEAKTGPSPEPNVPAKPGRRKRASVPSWDEIMFGGPKQG